MRRPILRLSAVAALLAGAWIWVEHERDRTALRFPGAHLLLVSIDTLRADALGCYGSGLALTPSFDALAGEGVAFLQATAASNHTAPSHATMLTGYSPDVHGVVNTTRSSPRALPVSIPTLAERLGAAGWRTAADTDGGYMHRAFGLGRGFDRYDYDATGMAAKVDRCLAYFDGLPPGARGFFFLHTYDTHGPYRVSAQEAEAIFERYPDSVIPDRYRALLKASGDEIGAATSRLLASTTRFRQADVWCLRELYQATIRNVDRELGRLVAGLRSRGLLDRMVVVATSDHGEEFADHGGYQHESIHDEVMRVPLIVRFPGAALAGTALATSFGAVHLTPTILETLGLAAQGMEGRSQRLGIAAGAVDDSARVAFAAHMDGERIEGHAARTPAAKVIVGDEESAASRAAYDLRAHPSESVRAASKTSRARTSSWTGS